MLHDLQPVEREVETPGGTWFRRRILPYRTEGNGIEGVVITFNDITRRKQEAAALEEAKGGCGGRQPRQVPLPGRGQPRPAPAVANAGRCSKGCWRATSRGTRRPGWCSAWTRRWAP